MREYKNPTWSDCSVVFVCICVSVLLSSVPFWKVDICFKDQISLSQTFQACWKIWDVMFRHNTPNPALSGGTWQRAGELQRAWSHTDRNSDRPRGAVNHRDISSLDSEVAAVTDWDKTACLHHFFDIPQLLNALNKNCPGEALLLSLLSVLKKRLRRIKLADVGAALWTSMFFLFPVPSI